MDPALPVCPRNNLSRSKQKPPQNKAHCTDSLFCAQVHTPSPSTLHFPGQCCDIPSGAEHLGWCGKHCCFPNRNCLLPAPTATGLGWLKARDPLELPKPPVSIQPRKALTEQPLPPAQPQPGMPALTPAASWEQLDEPWALKNRTHPQVILQMAELLTQILERGKHKSQGFVRCRSHLGGEKVKG